MEMEGNYFASPGPEIHLLLVSVSAFAISKKLFDSSLVYIDHLILILNSKFL